jgi:hypothetical protein
MVRLTRAGIRVVVASLLLLSTRAHGRPTAAQKCQASKDAAAGGYAFCRQKAEGSLALASDMTNYTSALAACTSKLSAAWQKAEQKAIAAGEVCPDASLPLARVRAVIDAHTSNIARALGGGPLLGPAARLKTGETDCDQGNGTMGACPGSPAGQDGALQAGLARSFTDNGDGTITDNGTGLTWEKISLDGSIHDAYAQYTWYDAFTSKIAMLNSINFAGHHDWRLPNASEAQTLAFYGATVDPAFNTNCTPGCTVLTCSCSSDTWTSTTNDGATNSAYNQLGPGDSRLSSTLDDKNSVSPVRAVRGGL